MAQIYLAAGEHFSSVGAGSNQITGTNANETVTVVANGDAVFDGSFNRGGDIIEIAGNAGEYVAKISGSFLVLTSTTGESNGADIRVPIGQGAGASIHFADAPPRVLAANGTTVTLGDQTIPLTVTVTVAPGVDPESQALAFSSEGVDLAASFTLVSAKGNPASADEIPNLDTFSSSAAAADSTTQSSDPSITPNDGAPNDPFYGYEYAAGLAFSFEFMNFA